MAEPLRWGIMGTGNIAGQFAAGVRTARRGMLVAVGSRAQASAAAFAQKHQIAAAHAGYEALLADRTVEAIYLSLPNSLHHEWTIRSLRAGKHVLCEKPFAVDAAQSQEMFDVAGKQGRVLVEAFMYRSHPQTSAILQQVRGGAIGQVKLIRTSFCYRTTRPQNIRFRHDLAGGAMMDVGCYCLNFARMIAGEEPDHIAAAATMRDSGVDDATAGVLRFPSGVLSTFSCGMSVQAENSAYICGTEGYLEVGWPWKPQRKAVFAIAHSIPPRQDAPPGAAPARPPRQEIAVEADGELYALEADDFAAAVRDGVEPRVTRTDTMGNMRALDEIRRQIGLVFEG